MVFFVLKRALYLKARFPLWVQKWHCVWGGHLFSRARSRARLSEEVSGEREEREETRALCTGGPQCCSHGADELFVRFDALIDP